MSLPSEDYRATALEVLKNLKDKAAAETAPGASPQERRRLIRLKCFTPVSCRAGDHSFAARAHDVSLGGMRLESPELAEGLELELRPQDEPGGWIRARVVWYSSQMGAGGIQFCEPPESLGKSWVVDLLHRLGLGDLSFVNRRKYTRARAELPAEVRVGKERWQGRVLDVGLGGALLELDLVLEGDTELELQVQPLRDLPELKVRGRVLAARPGDAGRWNHNLQFDALEPNVTRILGRYVVELLRTLR